MMKQLQNCNRHSLQCRCMYINRNAFDLLGEYSVNEDNSKDISHIMNKTAFHIRVLNVSKSGPFSFSHHFVKFS